MKKIIVLFLCIVLCIAVMPGCTEKADVTEENTQNGTSVEKIDVSKVAVPSSEAFADIDFTGFEAIVLEQEKNNINFASLNAVDANGDTVTADILKDYDVTAVNIWTTWCPACMGEMPFLNKLYTELPENMNYIGMCLDAETAPADFEYVLGMFPHDYTVIATNNKDTGGVALGSGLAYPTTYFVDKNGDVIGKYLGVPVLPNATTFDENIVTAYKKLFKDALEKIEAK